MANYTTDAINLKSYNFNEADKIVVMYSREMGLIRCVAKGIRKPSSKLGGRMETLVSNKLLLYKGKKLDTVCQAEANDTFKALRKDISKLTYAIYCAELINTFGLEQDSNSKEIYDNFYEALKNISLAKGKKEILWSVIRFQLRLSELLGYAIELDNCVKCSSEITDVFSFCNDSGGVVCNSCRMYVNKDVHINGVLKSLLKEAHNFDFSDNINSYDEMTLNCCFDLLKEYISVRSHKKLKSTDLIGCLC